jgi:hypothetical protein
MGATSSNCSEDREEEEGAAGIGTSTDDGGKDG